MLTDDLDAQPDRRDLLQSASRALAYRRRSWTGGPGWARSPRATRFQGDDQGDDPAHAEGHGDRQHCSDASGLDQRPDHLATTSFEVAITVDTQADLSIAKTGPSTATAGDPAGFDYTISVTNHGPSDNAGGFKVS